LVVGPFSDFVNREEQEKLKITVGDSSEWAPSATGGVWKALGEAAALPDFRKKTVSILHPSFSDEQPLCGGCMKGSTSLCGSGHTK
jgi:hypothetical protein